jgi:hypothetical protein
VVGGLREQQAGVVQEVYRCLVDLLVDPVVTLPPVHSLRASGGLDESLVSQPPALLLLENTDITAWSTGTTGLVVSETAPPALPHRLAAEFKSGFYVPDEAEELVGGEDRIAQTATGAEEEEVQEGGTGEREARQAEVTFTKAFADTKEELDAMVVEATSQPSSAASATQLWFMLSNALVTLPKDESYQELALPCFLQLLAWSVRDDALSTKEGQQRLLDVCDAAGRLRCNTSKLRTKLGAARKQCEGLARDRRRQVFYDQVHRHAASLAPPKVVLRDIVVHTATQKGSAALHTAEASKTEKVNKNKQESMHKIALKAMVDGAESAPSAFEKAKLLWASLQPYLVEMEEDSRKLAVTAVKEVRDLILEITPIFQIVNALNHLAILPLCFIAMF